jgi:hypothetical protein
VFDLELDGLLPGSSFLTLTATESATGNTSESSECFLEIQPDGLRGDVNGDDEVLAADALTTLRTAVGTANCDTCFCDVNNSGEVTTSHALNVLRVAVGQQVELHCPICIGTP